MAVPSQDSLNKPFGASRPEIAKVQLLLLQQKLQKLIDYTINHLVP